MIYPTEYGINVSVEIIRDPETDTATIKVHAPMYVKKEWVMSFCYKSSEFSDYEILQDRTFKSQMILHYPK